MKLQEISYPQNSKRLNENLTKLFNTKINIDSFTLEQLQDARNKIRTTLSQIETNESYNNVSQNGSYQKNRLFLDVLNAAISEREHVAETENKKPDADGDGVPDWADKQDGPDPTPKKKGTKNMPPQLRKHAEKNMTEKAVSQAQQQAAGIAHAAQKGEIPASELQGASKEMAKMGKKDLKDFASTKHKGLPKKKNESIIREGEEDKAELVMAAKDMVDRITSWMEDTAEMQSESMLEIGDAIRDELGQQVSTSFIDQIKPSLETLYQTLESTRQALTSGVALLTGEEQPEEMMGEEPPMEEPGMEPTIDDEELGDDFSASEPAMGGEAEPGRTKRESIEFSRKLGLILSSKKK